MGERKAEKQRPAEPNMAPKLFSRGRSSLLCCPGQTRNTVTAGSGRRDWSHPNPLAHIARRKGRAGYYLNRASSHGHLHPAPPATPRWSIIRTKYSIQYLHDHQTILLPVESTGGIPDQCRSGSCSAGSSVRIWAVGVSLNGENVRW